MMRLVDSVERVRRRGAGSIGTEILLRRRALHHNVGNIVAVVMPRREAASQGSWPTR